MVISIRSALGLNSFEEKDLLSKLAEYKLQLDQRIADNGFLFDANNFQGQIMTTKREIEKEGISEESKEMLEEHLKHLEKREEEVAGRNTVTSGLSPLVGNGVNGGANKSRPKMLMELLKDLGDLKFNKGENKELTSLIEKEFDFTNESDLVDAVLIINKDEKSVEASFLDFSPSVMSLFLSFLERAKTVNKSIKDKKEFLRIFEERNNLLRRKKQ